MNLAVIFLFYLTISMLNVIIYFTFFRNCIFKPTDEILKDKDTNNVLICSFIPFVNCLILFGFIICLILFVFSKFFNNGSNR